MFSGLAAAMLSWDPLTKEASFPVLIHQHTIVCRIPAYVLHRVANGPDAHPFKLASEAFDVLLDVAISKASQHLYERDGTVILRVVDFYISPDTDRIHRASR